MATLAEIVSSITDQVTGHFPVDDTRLRERFVEKVINDKRAALVHRESKRLGLHRGWYTLVDCMEVHCGPVHCAGIPAGEKRYYINLPDLVPSRWSIAFLGTLGGVEFIEAAPSSFLKYEGDVPGACTYMQLDGKAIFRNFPFGLKKIRLHAVLQDPQKFAEELGDCMLDFREQRYPVPEIFLHELEMMSIRQMLALKQVQPDKTNDAADLTGDNGQAAKNLDRT